MVRRFHRSIYDELDELRASMDYLFQLAFDPMDNPLLPQGEDPGISCHIPHNLNAEVTESDDEIMVTLELFPGSGKATLSADLANPQILRITCDRQEEMMEENEGRVRSLSVHHEILLPGPVARTMARSTLKNGVLDIRLKKVLTGSTIHS